MSEIDNTIKRHELEIENEQELTEITEKKIKVELQEIKAKMDRKLKTWIRNQYKRPRNT